VRSACVRGSGVVRGSMGEMRRAGISFFALPPLHRVIPALNWDPVSGSAAAYASNYGVYWVSGRARDDANGERIERVAAARCLTTLGLAETPLAKPPRPPLYGLRAIPPQRGTPIC